ncbi:MAG TPA: hypothetical protein VLJ18_00160 [Thermoanaerobaculia bacterium]|nr:hypothetical protein [Thermoanaerobaculia bacterium]
MAFERIFRSATSALLAASVTLLSSGGCATFSVEGTSPDKGSPPRAASLRFSVYESRAALKKAEIFGGSIRSKLMMVEPLPDELIFESSDAFWSIPDLAPGKYRLEVSQRTGPEPGAPEVRSWRENVKVRTGEEVSAVIILSDKRAWAWGGASVGIAGAAVVGALVLVGIVSLGTRGITFSRAPVAEVQVSRARPGERAILER